MTARTGPDAHATWPPHLRSVGAVRFARNSSRFEDTVAFYRDLVGLPLHETFVESYGSTGAIFGLPGSALTLEVVDAGAGIVGGEQLSLYFPSLHEMDVATARLREAGVDPLATQHPYWAATGGVTYVDPDGRSVTFAPFVYGRNEPDATRAQRPPGRSAKE